MSGRNSINCPKNAKKIFFNDFSELSEDRDDATISNDHEVSPETFTQIRYQYFVFT
jgi:hypothetical protein